MRKTFAFITIIFCSISITVKSQSLNKKVVEYFGEEKSKELLETKPKTYTYYNYYVDSSYVIQEITNKPIDHIPELHFVGSKSHIKTQAIELKNIDDFNPLLYQIELNEETNAYYRISGTNYLVTFKSKKSIQEELNNK